MSNPQPFFTLFIPTYNRGYCIDKAVLSCENSHFKDFEVVLIDDGSTDNTREVIESIQEQLSFPFRYVYQENQGKHQAFNHAVTLANGQFFLTLDSDDTLLADGLGELYKDWQSVLQLDNAEKFASVEFRCVENGVPSSAVPEPFLDSSYVARRGQYKMRGEKRSAYRLDVLKNFPYPKFEGERYCRPGLIDNRIAIEYKTRFVNTLVVDAGHFDDGIGANRRKIIVNAPEAYRLYFLEEITQHAQYNTKKDLRSFYKRYCRCSINAGYSLKEILKPVPNKQQLLKVYPEAWFGSLGDKRFRKKSAVKS